MKLGEGEAKFSGGGLAFFGTAMGAAIAILVPLVLMLHGREAGLGPIAISILFVLAVGGGTSLAIVSAFFGLVIPKAVGGKVDIQLGKSHPKRKAS